MAAMPATDQEHPNRTSRLVGAMARTLARRVPAIAADPDGPDDVAATVQAVCMTALHRRGRFASLRAAILELVTLAKLALGRRRAAEPPRPDVPRRRRPAVALSARFAWKRLAGARANTAWAVGTLALGIGLTTSVFSVLDSILWRPAPYPFADRLVELATYNVERKFLFGGLYSPALIRAWRSETDLFDRIEGYDTPTMPYEGTDGSETVAVADVTPGIFPLLDASPERGRLFVPGDGRGAVEAVVLSDAFWRGRLHADPDVIGRRLVIDNAPRQVVGVLPASFRFPNGRVEVWMPFDVDAPPMGAGAPRTLTPVARLAPGRTFEAGQLEARARGVRLSQAVGEPANQTAYLFRLSGTVDEKTEQSLWVLAGAVGFLFLVVAANVANLALARALQRTRDLAVHAALGATSADLVRVAFLENVIVATIGSVAGVAIALGLTHVARTSLPEAMTTSAFNPIALNARAAAFAVALGSAAALLLGAPIAWAVSRAPVNAILGSHSRSTTGSRASRRLRAGLVVAEVAVCTALLIGAAVMTRTFVGLETAGRGFDTSNLISIRVGLPASYLDPAVRRQFVIDALDRLRATPGVVAATDGGLPTEVRPIMLGAVAFADRSDPTPAPLILPTHEVPAGYFSALGLPVLGGRVFGPDDDRNTLVVSEAFARKYWPGRSAIGARFHGAGQDWQTIVGIVGDVRPMTAGGFAPGQDLYYQTGKAPAAMQPRMSAASSIVDYRTLLVRVGHGGDAPGSLPRVIHSIDPRLVIWSIAPVDHLYDDAMARPRTVFLLMAIFAGVGLALAMAGMYGVLSHLVSQRLREIGVRFALGARPLDVGRAVLGSGLGLTAVGLVIGLGLAVGMLRLAATILTEVGRPDAPSLTAVVALLGLTAAAAAWSPARRAMRVDPVRLLRED